MTGRALYTIDAGLPFADLLAEGILARFGGDPLTLADVQVLLPTRRSCRSLRDAFLRVTGGRPTVLPRLSPIGEVTEIEALLSPDEAEFDGSGLDLPPAMPATRRSVLLARLIRARDPAIPPDRALALARDLGRLVDEAATEGRSLEDLSSIVPDQLATHWQETLRFLEIVITAWPEVLAESGMIDRVERRDRAILDRARRWGEVAPKGPVIVAGSTGSIPATATLIDVASQLPQGEVVLPALDRALAAEEWDAIDDRHPQSALKRLLDRLGVEPRDVAVWPWAAGGRTVAGSLAARRSLLAASFTPAELTDRWRDGAIPETAYEGLEIIEAAGRREEAASIAMLLRLEIETPGRTAMLVTPDRDLARRVRAELNRWGIGVDDSAGRPLATTPVGAFLRLIGDVAFQEAAPRPLLALLKHPLTTLAEPAGAIRPAVRALERAVWRGPRPPAGFDGLRLAVERIPDNRVEAAWPRALLANLVARLAKAVEPFALAVAGRDPLPPQELLSLHLAAAEALASTSDGEAESGGRLWRGDDGEAASLAVAEIADALEGEPAIAGRDWPGLFEALIDGVAVRPRWGRHPHLRILGPLEARLESADLVVLGGLDEGVWPALPAPDPWLSRAMRQGFGLPSPDRRIGQSAHDFATLAASPRVVLSRASKVGGAPTVPSRWLMRLEAVSAASGRAVPRLAAPLRWASLIDRPDEAPKPVGPPQPRPPVSARPRRLNVTEIGTLITDPYEVYAKRVLRLEPLDPIDADPGAADRGTAIHEVLARFFTDRSADLPTEPLSRLVEIGRRVFAQLPPAPSVQAFWWPRFMKIAAWFVGGELLPDQPSGSVRVEVAGRLELAAPAGPVLVTGRADRIDRLADGSAAITDYKTGSAPSAKQVHAGYAPQLPIEAIMLEDGGFEGIEPLAVSSLRYVRLTGGQPPGEIREIDDAPVAIAKARQGLDRLIRTFDDPEHPYLCEPRGPARFARYGHLARVMEWAAADGGDGE